jgi:hypothetical protein
MLIFSSDSLHISQKTQSVSIIKIKKKIPLQAWTGPEGSNRLRLPDFKTIGI